MTAQTGDTIDILLATYNGEAFLEEQLDSIAAQTHGDWQLIARDDGSSDRTVAILDAFRARHSDKVVVLRDGDGNLGLVQNFSRLMEVSDAPYAAFCDQDDVWMPEKLELSLAKMRELEREHGAETPLLVFTDLTVVDEALKVIHPSFWDAAGLKPAWSRILNRILTQNVATGCTILSNPPLLRLATPLPRDAVVHDWWLTLAASAFGAIAFVQVPSVLYRQHSRNVMGGRPPRLTAVLLRAIDLVMGHPVKGDDVTAVFIQARGFLSQYATQLSGSQRETLATFLEIPRHGALRRTIHAVRGAHLPPGVLRKLRFVFFSRNGPRDTSLHRGQ